MVGILEDYIGKLVEIKVRKNGGDIFATYFGRFTGFDNTFIELNPGIEIESSQIDYVGWIKGHEELVKARKKSYVFGKKTGKILLNKYTVGPIEVLVEE